MKITWWTFAVLLLVFVVCNQLVVCANKDVMDISKVQQILNKSGYECRPVDSIKSERTIAAIRLFQQLHDIRENGIVGEETKQALLQAEEEKKVIDYLLKTAPELQEVVNKHKATDLICYVQAFPRTEESNRYARDYYNVYIGFRVMDHRTRMATFLVGKELNEVLYDNSVTGRYISLEEWRKLKDGHQTGFDNNLAANDWLCIPFQRVGPITSATTASELIELFGEENVQRRLIPGAEGAEYYNVSVVYPDTPNQLIIFWQNNRYDGVPQSVSVRQAGTAWTTVYGITVGTSLEELNRINGQPFTIRGFGWDYGGYVTAWNDGTLAAVQGITLRLRPAMKLPQDFYGDGVKVDSSDNRILPDAVRVGDFSVMLKKPHIQVNEQVE